MTDVRRQRSMPVYRPWRDRWVLLIFVVLEPLASWGFDWTRWLFGLAFFPLLVLGQTGWLGYWFYRDA